MAQHSRAGITTYYDYPINRTTVENQLVSNPRAAMTPVFAQAVPADTHKTIKTILAFTAVIAVVFWARNPR
jgi:hypothetical protein